VIGTQRGFGNVTKCVPGVTPFVKRSSLPLNIGLPHGDIQRKWKSLRIVTSMSLRMKKNLLGRRRQSLATSAPTEGATDVVMEEDGIIPAVIQETKRQITDARRVGIIVTIINGMRVTLSFLFAFHQSHL